MPVDLPKISEMRDRISEMLSTTRYTPDADIPTDEHGMPILTPEPTDPDDE